METSGDSTFRSRFWRFVRAARVIYFASLTTIPVIGCVYRDDPRVVVICFLILLLTGVALDSGPIVLMILAAAVGPNLIPHVGSGHDIAWQESSAFGWSLVGLASGVMLDQWRRPSPPSVRGKSYEDSKQAPATLSTECERSIPDA